MTLLILAKNLRLTDHLGIVKYKDQYPQTISAKNILAISILLGQAETRQIRHYKKTNQVSYFNLHLILRPVGGLGSLPGRTVSLSLIFPSLPMALL